MKSTAVFSLVTFILVGTVAADVAAPAAPREVSLEAQVTFDALFGQPAECCIPSRCYCNRVQGRFCGNQEVNANCLNGHVFECNAQTGYTCDYGFRTSCERCGKPSC